MRGRLMWLMQQGCLPTVSDIHGAVSSFHTKYNMVPDVIKMSLRDMSDFLSMVNNPIIQTLDTSKNYANYVTTVCGPVKLVLMSQEEVETIHASGTIVSVILVENTEIDKEFEKHVLNV
jgi:Na+-transporting methylmalonyl-CoA/oxaloacetate decarboxylase beta subunit